MKERDGLRGQRDKQKQSGQEEFISAQNVPTGEQFPDPLAYFGETIVFYNPPPRPITEDQAAIIRES